MASNLQYSVAVNNARLDAIETAVGVTPLLRLYTGTQPSNCATAASGTLLVEMTLPSNWMSDAASAAKAKLGTWSGTGIAAGNAGYYRLYDSTGTTCHEQGTVGTSGTDLIADNINIAVGQTITVTGYTKNAANT